MNKNKPQTVAQKMTANLTVPFREISKRGYTKAAYAKKINKSHTWVNQLIEDGELIEIKINGGSFIYSPK